LIHPTCKDNSPRLSTAGCIFLTKLQSNRSQPFNCDFKEDIKNVGNQGVLVPTLLV